MVKYTLVFLLLVIVSCTGLGPSDPSNIAQLQGRGCLKIRVLYGVKSPAVGCTVSLIELAGGYSPQLSGHAPKLGAFKHVHETLGQHYLTNADGIVIVPASKRPLSVAAYTETHFENMMIDANETDLRVLKLEVAMELSVEVIQSDGRPLDGGFVSIRSIYHAGLFEETSESMSFFGLESIITERPTDSRGQTTFICSAHSLASCVGAGAWTLGVIDSRGNSFILERESWFAENATVKIQLPEPASIDVTVFEPDGTQCTETVELWLSHRPGESHRLSRLSQDDHPPEKFESNPLSFAPRSRRFRVENGRAHIPFHVAPLKLRYEIHGLRGSTVIPVDGEFDGPTSPGEKVHLRIDLEERLPVVRGRLVDREGNPIAKTKFDVSHFCRYYSRSSLFRIHLHSDGSHEETMTDSNGRFRWVPWLHSEWDEEVRGRQISIDSGNPVMWATQIGLPTSPLKGVIDVGDTLVHERMVLVKGRVVDDNGHGLSDVEVEVKIGGGRQMDSSKLTTSFPESVQADSHGFFKVTGISSESHLRVSANKDALQSKDMVVAKGSNDVVIVLRP